MFSCNIRLSSIYHQICVTKRGKFNLSHIYIFVLDSQNVETLAFHFRMIRWLLPEKSRVIFGGNNKKFPFKFSRFIFVLFRRQCLKLNLVHVLI